MKRVGLSIANRLGAELANIGAILMKRTGLVFAAALCIGIMSATASAQTTYTWNQTGAASWATSTNWTPTRTTPATNDILQFNNGATTSATNIPTQTIGRLSISSNTNVTLSAGGGGQTLTIGNGTGNDLVIASGSSLTCNASLDNIVLATSATADISGTFTNNATYDTNGTSVVTTVTGTIINSATVTNATASKLLFQSGSTYQHSQNGGTIPTATWNAASTCNITGIVGNQPGGMNQAFGHFTWNCTGQSSDHELEPNGMSIAGNFTVASTGANDLRMLNTGTARTLTVSGNYSQTGGTFVVISGAGAGTLNVDGNFSLTGGTFVLKEDDGNAALNVDGNYSQSAGTFTFRNVGTGTAAATVLGNFSLSGTAAFNMTSSGVATLNVSGNYSLTAGTHDMSSGTSGNNSFGTMNLGGDFTHTGGTITETNTGNGTIVFNGSGTQTYTSGGTVSNTINFTVNSGSTLQMGTGASPSTMPGGGAFTLSSGARLGITSTAGITSSGATGNIQVTGTRTYNTGANYIYNGAASQATGNGLPATVNNLTINNSGTGNNNVVTLGANLSVSAALLISDGALNQGATFNLTVTGATTINSGGTLNILDTQTGNFTATGGVTVNSGGGWEAFGGTAGDPVVITLGGNVSNAGLIHFDSGNSDCGDADNIQIRSSVGGTQRTWSGAGSFLMQDVNVQDQNKSGTAITANSSTNNGNNTNWTFTATCNAVTEVTLASFAALGNDRQGVYLQWQTGYEVRNLGFNLYREVKGKRTKLNATLIAGSALMVGLKTRLTAGLSYGWLDTTANASDFAQYFLEDVDLGGQTTLHGPISPTPTSKLPAQADALLLSKLNSNSSNVKQQFITPLIKSSNGFGKSIINAAGSIQTQWDVAGQPGAKLSVRSDGWYRVTQPELVAAGFNVSSNPNFLQLYVDGVQQPIKVNGGTSGHLQAGDSIEFYAKAIDTPSTNLRAYYLINGNAQGQRINTVAGSGVASTAQNFSATIERKERSTYFAALRNGDADNWFGAIITSDAVTQTFAVEHLDASSATGATLEVALQGVTADTSHSVKVKLNGNQVGTISFNGQAHQVSSLTISNSALVEGNNTVSFEAEGGDLDINLLDYVRLTYSHTFAADNNRLLYTAAGQELVTISGFNSSAIRVVDITDPANPKEISGTTNGSGNNFSITVAAQDAGQRVLYAFADSAVSQAAEVRANQPSSWNRATQVADLVIITPRNFIAGFDALKTLRRSQGYTVVVADVEDLYDEFSYGARTPQAIKDFLARTKSTWKRAPKFVLLGGDASSDPKNYLGLGDNDYVPTKLIDTALMETASDDWLVDFNNDGLPEMAIGRMPARTANESATMVRKTVEYAQLARPEGALLVTDTNDEFNFEATSNEVKALIPNSIVVREVMRSAMDDQTAHAQILGHLQRGPKIVNYLGHGSFGLWRGNLLTSADAASLSNGPEYSFVIGMTCLNGQVQDPFGDGLAEALMKVEQGGAIAVWASSALTEPDGQALLNKELFRHLFPAFKSSAPGLTLGEAVMKAKAASSDMDVKRSWILLGDPTTKLR